MIRLGGDPAGSWIHDVNGDGLADAVLLFRTGDTGIKCGDTAAPWTAETGIAVHGSGAFRCSDEDRSGPADRSTSARTRQRVGVQPNNESAYR